MLQMFNNKLNYTYQMKYTIQIYNVCFEIFDIYVGGKNMYFDFSSPIKNKDWYDFVFWPKRYKLINSKSYAL